MVFLYYLNIEEGLNLGDQNSSYFFKLVKIRASRNLITHLWDDNGGKVVEENQIKQVAVDFYKKLLGSESLVFDEDKANRVSKLITKRITTVQCAMLQAEVTDTEIMATVFAMKNEKALGPDEASVHSISAVQKVLSEFESLSGLKANPDKNGVLYEKYGHRVIYDAHRKLEAQLESIIQNGQWYWPTARLDYLVNIQSRLCMVPIGDKDKPKWNVSKTGTFSCLDTWDSNRVRGNIVDWWFPLSIPKQAFITWLAMRDALTTGRNLLIWGVSRGCEMHFL
ncbi:hypothetical protein Q3G72_015568 [Acer saccharum]|nr:hypothetical protein Q3G72_012732 [Acer saccharum]KAK1562670.1 hypothetical protein Q3G72_015568 [Acer saccharum]